MRVAAISSPDAAGAPLSELSRDPDACSQRTVKGPRDGVETITGVECRVICNEAVGLHSRDLDQLADTLEAIDAGKLPLGALPPRES